MTDRRHRRRREARLLAALLVLVAGCSTHTPEEPAPASTPGGVTTDPTTTPAAPAQHDPGVAGPDVTGLIDPHPSGPQVAWMLDAASLDLPGAQDVDLYDPRHRPTLDGWPMVGVLDVGGVWVIGAADADSDRQWLLVLDPATGDRLATIGLTRSQGPPSSCTAALADATIACLYGDVLEVLDPAAGAAVARIPLDSEPHSVHTVDGDILLLDVADDGTAVHLARLAPDGEEQWAQGVDLDADEALAMAGGYLPVVQSVPGLVLVGVADLQLALDAETGAVAHRAVAEVLATGPDGGLIASSQGAPDWGIEPYVRWLDESASVVRDTAGLSWLPATANSGRVEGPVVTDAGDAVVGVQPGGGEAWRLTADPDQVRLPMVRADGVVVLQDTAGLMTAVEPATGQVRWHREGGSEGWGARGWNSLTDGERMVLRSAEGIAAVDLTDGSLVWQVRVPTGDGQVWELVEIDGGVVAAGQRTLSVFSSPAQ